MKRIITLFVFLGLLCSNQVLQGVGHDFPAVGLEEFEAQAAAAVQRHRQEDLVRIPREMMGVVPQEDIRMIGGIPHVSGDVLAHEVFPNLPHDVVLGFRLVSREWNRAVKEYFTSLDRLVVKRIAIKREEFTQVGELRRKLEFIKQFFGNVEFVCRGMTVDGMRLIAQTLGDQVIGLVLNFFGYVMPLPHLSIALQGLGGLQQLTLDLNGTNITDAGFDVAHLGGALRGLGGLQQLTLDLKWTRITDEGLDGAHLGGALRGLTGLQQLTLDVGGTEMTDIGLDGAHLGGALRGLTGLKQLTLDVGGTEMTDRGITDIGLDGAHLGGALQELTGLKQLTLNLSFKWLPLDVGETEIRDRGITDIGLDGAHLGGVLQRLTGLRQLTLDLSGTRITDGGLDDLGGVLQRLTGLRQLMLDLGHTGITYRGLDLGHTGITYRGLGDFRNSLNHIPNLEIKR